MVNASLTSQLGAIASGSRTHTVHTRQLPLSCGTPSNSWCGDSSELQIFKYFCTEKAREMEGGKKTDVKEKLALAEEFKQ